MRQNSMISENATKESSQQGPYLRTAHTQKSHQSSPGLTLKRPSDVTSPYASRCSSFRQRIRRMNSPKNLYWEISPHSSRPFFLLSSRQFQSISIQIPIKKYIIPSCIQLSSRRVGVSLNHPFVSSPLLCEPPQSEFSLRRSGYMCGR